MKRVISIILCAVFCISTLAVSVFAGMNELLPIKRDNSYTLGDVNSDGEFDAKDAFALKDYIAGNDTEISSDASDVDANGKLSAADVFYFKAFIAGALNKSDYEKGVPVYSFKIGDISIDNFDITVPSDTVPAESSTYTAATILKQYIKATTGYDINILVGEREKSHAIVYHFYDKGTKEAAEMDLGLEDFTYRVENGDLHIYGSIRGNLYATYDIIETFLGIRFYSNTRTYSYDKRCVNIPESTDYTYKVKLQFRFAGYPVADGGSIYQYYYALKNNGTCINAGGEPYDGYQVGPRGALGHSFGYYRALQSIPMPTEGTLAQRLNKKWQDGIANIAASYTQQQQNEWQPCCTNNQEYYRMLNGFLEATEMFQSWGYSNHYTDEAVKYGDFAMTFSINDSDTSCTCRYCSAKINGTTINANEKLYNMITTYYTGEYTLNGSKITFKKEGKAGLFVDFTNRAIREVTTEYHGNDYTYGDGGDFKELYALDPEIRTVYDGMKMNFIIYDHSIPESVRPDSRLQIMYVSHGCYNHTLGSGGCGENTTVLGNNNNNDEKAMKAWSEFCHESGASIYYYSHGVSYSCYLAPSPNILDFYYNMKYILCDCEFDGILYESTSVNFNFEPLKSYLISRVSWNPDMSYEEFTDIMKEYLYMYYGEGYEKVYQYILLQTKAGETDWCWTNNHDRPWDMYSEEFIAEHYEEMRTLLVEAEQMAKDDIQKEKCRLARVSIEFLGLSACYDTMYTNGTALSRKTYEERYDWMYNMIVDNELEFFSGNPYPVPEKSYDEQPMTQFIVFGSWRNK